MGSFDFITLFFFVAAVIVFFQLRNVLGRRTGSERPPVDPYSGRRDSARAEESEDGKVVTLPRRDGQAPSPDAGTAAADAYADPGTSLNDGLRAVTKADPAFDPEQFVEGAKAAYEMIVTAFAEGDRKTLKPLLSRDVYEGFAAAINERESKSETVKTSFVGIEKASITHAELRGQEASVTVRMVSQMISVTHDKDDAVVDGDADEVAEVTDTWTFSRDTRSHDPNWKLSATESED